MMQPIHEYNEVRGQVPRKQGLKPPGEQGAEKLESPRASSTKTRIETPRTQANLSAADTVRGQVPRKQGLKLPIAQGWVNNMAMSEGKFHENKD